MYWDDVGQATFLPPQTESERLTEMWKQFEEYDKQNPQIFDAFCRFTRQCVREGHTKLGAHFIMHLIRWKSSVRGAGPVKVNHNYFPYYARKFMKIYPEHQGLFELRQLKT